MASRDITNPITATTRIDPIAIDEATALARAMPPAISVEIRQRAAFNHWFDGATDRLAQAEVRHMHLSSSTRAGELEDVLDLLHANFTIVDRALHNNGVLELRKASVIDKLLDRVGTLLDKAERPPTLFEALSHEWKATPAKVHQLNSQITAFGESIGSWIASKFGIDLPAPDRSPLMSHSAEHREIDKRAASLAYWKAIIEGIGDPNPHIEITDQGVPGAGMVYHLQQVHAPRSGQISPASARSVAELQGAVLRFLSDQNALHVFDEELGSTLTSSTAGYADAADEARQLFGKSHLLPLVTNTSLEQREMLVSQGGARVYHRLNPDSVLHSTISGTESQAITGATPKGARHREALVMHAREAIAMQRVQSFLQENPGEKAFLVYGGAHEMGTEDLLGPGPKPTFVRVSWPGLEMKDWATASLLLHQLKDLPGLHALLIDRVDGLAPLAFAYLDESNQRQLLASGKLEIGQTIEQRRADIATLKALSKSAAVRALVDDLIIP